MHIAYNALKCGTGRNQQDDSVQKKYDAYLSVCNKYKHEIAAIQKYIPGWRPTFNNTEQ